MVDKMTIDYRPVCLMYTSCIKTRPERTEYTLPVTNRGIHERHSKLQ